MVQCTLSVWTALILGMTPLSVVFCDLRHLLVNLKHCSPSWDSTTFIAIISITKFKSQLALFASITPQDQILLIGPPYKRLSDTQVFQSNIICCQRRFLLSFVVHHDVLYERLMMNCTFRIQQYRKVNDISKFYWTHILIIFTISYAITAPQSIICYVYLSFLAYTFHDFFFRHFPICTLVHNLTISSKFLAWTSNGSAHCSPTHLSVQPSGSHRWAGFACQPTARTIPCWCPWQWRRFINKRCISASWESCFTSSKSVARLWETVPKEFEKVTSIVLSIHSSCSTPTSSIYLLFPIWLCTDNILKYFSFSSYSWQAYSLIAFLTTLITLPEVNTTWTSRIRSSTYARNALENRG